MVAPIPEKVTPELVFREYAPRIYNIARRMLGNDADAEDVTQDVLLQVVRKLDTFRGDSQIATWLHRVTVNAALAHRQNVHRYRALAPVRPASAYRACEGCDESTRTNGAGPSPCMAAPTVGRPGLCQAW